MRTEKPAEPQEPNNNRKQRGAKPRPKRGAANGPLGFGSVMRDVRSTGAPTESTTPGAAGFDQAAFLAAQRDAGSAAAGEMGAAQSTEQHVAEAAFGIQSATDALAQQDRSITHATQAQPAIPTDLGRMTPAALLSTIVDEATMLEIEEASKELHVELEPADLGPLIVEIRRDPNGKLSVRFRAREADAARVLDAGSTLLGERLTEAGFSGSEIRVDHDAELVFDGR